MDDKSFKEILAPKIEHTALLPITTRKAVDLLCKEAKDFNFRNVIVLPTFVQKAKNNLKNTNIKVGTIVGFPLGGILSSVKSYETLAALMEGADEIDFVMNIPKFLDNELFEVQKEIKTIVEHVKKKNGICKVIIETCLLSDSQKIKAANLIIDSGADFIQTSTGFSKSGVTVEDIILLKKNIKDKIKIKAAAGIRTAKFAIDLIQAGADTIGTSAGIKIMMEAEQLDKEIKRSKLKLI